MADKRELILVRLLEIAQGVPGVVTAARNVDALDEDARPAIIILDADETADDSDPRGRQAYAPRRVGMTPEIYLMLGEAPENVGTAINAMRAAFIKAVLTDTPLREICGTNGDIRYEACATSLARGRMLEAECGVSFSFIYVLNPRDL